MQLLQSLRHQPKINSEIFYPNLSSRPILFGTLLIGLLLVSLLGIRQLQFTIPPVPSPEHSLTASVLTVSTANAGASPQIVPTCHPGSYSLPSQLSTTGHQPGVYIAQDKPTSYPIYGLSTDEINRQMADCTPIVEDGQRYGANTGYALSSYYTYGSVDATNCKVLSVVVTAHINQIFPAWRQPGKVPGGLLKRWQTFTRNVHTHEQGHVDLDRHYAQQLYNDLLEVPIQDCPALKQAADATTQRDYNAVIQANADYDAQTKHGTTQGAVL